MCDNVVTTSQIPIKNKDVKIKVYDKDRLVEPLQFSHFTMGFDKIKETEQWIAEIFLHKVHTDPLPFEMFFSKDSVYRIVIEIAYSCVNEYCKKNNANIYVYEFNNCRLESIESKMGSKQKEEVFGEWDKFTSTDSLYFQSQNFEFLKEVGHEKKYERIVSNKD